MHLKSYQIDGKLRSALAPQTFPHPASSGRTTI